jgi:hypothetical protein
LPPLTDGSLAPFLKSLAGLTKALRTSKRRKVLLGSNSFYATKVRSELASFRKSFLALRDRYPSDRFQAVSFQLAAIEPLVNKIVASYPSAPDDILSTSTELVLKVESDVAHAIESADATPLVSSTAPFIPNELLQPKHFVLKKVLWEINQSYHSACYNSCAAMIRRLIESLIIDAFESLGIGAAIKSGDNYLDFADLIGKATAEGKLKLTRNTKRILPDLKFFGDLAVHNRNALVRKDDIDRLHHAIRSGVEELARHLS